MSKLESLPVLGGAEHRSLSCILFDLRFHVMRANELQGRFEVIDTCERELVVPLLRRRCQLFVHLWHLYDLFDHRDGRNFLNLLLVELLDALLLFSLQPRRLEPFAAFP